MEFITNEEFSLKEIIDRCEPICEDVYLNSPLIGECRYVNNIIVGDCKYYRFRNIYVDIYGVTDTMDGFLTEALFDEFGRYVDARIDYRVSVWQGIFPLSE